MRHEQNDARRLALLAGLSCLTGYACTLDATGTAAQPADASTGGEGGGLVLTTNTSSSATGQGGDAQATTTASSSVTASSSTATGGGGGEGGGEVGPVCGDGVVEGSESCDDMNTDVSDGCAGCNVVDGYTCAGMPSLCTEIEPMVVSVDLELVIQDDNSYTGAIPTMDCVDLVVGTSAFDTVQRVELTVAMDHDYVGDLVIKLVSPTGTVTTLMSRPGRDEPADTSSEPNGDSSDLRKEFPITFRDDAPYDAELMGDDINGGEVVCEDDEECDFFPNPGAGPGINGMADFALEDPTGTWLACFADGDDTDEGTVDAVTLTVLAW